MEEAMVSMQAGQNHSGRKFRVLERGALCLQGPGRRQRSQVMCWQRSCPPGASLTRPPPPRHAFRQEDRPCYRLVDLRTSRLPCVLRLPLWEGRKCGQSETCAGGALRGPRSDPASTVQWPQARQFQLPSRLSHGALPETISPAPLVPSLTVDLEKSTPCLLHWASRVS